MGYAYDKGQDAKVRVQFPCGAKEKLIDRRHLTIVPNGTAVRDRLTSGCKVLVSRSTTLPPFILEYVRTKRRGRAMALSLGYNDFWGGYMFALDGIMYDTRYQFQLSLKESCIVSLLDEEAESDDDDPKRGSSSSGEK